MGQKYAAYDSTGKITGFYDSVDSPVPTGINAIPITDQQWQTCLEEQGQWMVSNGALAQVPPPSAAQQLATAQASQSALLTQACNTNCDSPFSSAALGAPYEYGASMDDQRNLSSAFMAASAASANAVAWAPSTEYATSAFVKVGTQVYRCLVAGVSGSVSPAWPNSTGQIVTDGSAEWTMWSASLWATSSSNVYAIADHNAPQVLQVASDFSANVQHCMTQLSTKLSAVAAATTVAAVQAIVWS